MDANAEVQPTETPTPAVTPAPAVAPAFDVQEYNALLAFKAQREQADRDLARQKALDSGQAERVAEHFTKEVADRETKLKALDERVRGSEKGRAMSDALAGKPLISPEVAKDIQSLWANDFETVDGPGGEFITRCKNTLRPVAEVVAERLASPRYAHFVQAASRGGSGASGGSAASATPAGQGKAPSLDDIFAQIVAAQKGVGR